MNGNNQYTLRATEALQTSFKSAAARGNPETTPTHLLLALIEQEEGIWFSPKAFDQAAERLAVMLAAQPEGVTVSEVREALGCSRKYALPLLNRLDRTGVTRRRDDVRIAGPRLPNV